MAASTIDPAAVRRLRAPLLRWYDRAKRDLPWRGTSDPYAIWVSEIMLQQTTVAAVIPYWGRFLRRFPDVASLARAEEEEVLALWTGLGYYRRARSLREGAIAVMERHAGRVPAGDEELRALPGIGRYTAGAIASLAFGHETPVVDGNVKRVFSRLFALAGAGAAVERTHWAVASELVRGARPGDLNQALMELGATVCTPRSPRCDACPVAAFCRGAALGTPEAFPTAAARKEARRVRAAVAWIERSGRVLLEQRHEGGPLRGTWDLPAATLARKETPARAIARALRLRHGIAFTPGGLLASVTHAILDRRLAIDVVDGTAGSVPRGTALRWALPSAIGEIATSGATTKIVRAVLAQKRSHVVRKSSSGSRGRAKA